jgi:hypothetical protein
MYWFLFYNNLGYKEIYKDIKLLLQMIVFPYNVCHLSVSLSPAVFKSVCLVCVSVYPNVMLLSKIIIRNKTIITSRNSCLVSVTPYEVQRLRGGLDPWIHPLQEIDLRASRASIFFIFILANIGHHRNTGFQIVIF